MSLPVRLSVAARGDRTRLAVFLVQTSPPAAERAVEAIAAGLRRLSRYPESGRIMEGSRRELPIRFGDSGYVVQYRVDPDAVVIARIFHMREDR